ncbi:MAG: aldo/keto reductase [Firmicutes bacterium]|nr:aldo/keto reductase [Bacillota bacterium]
MNYKEDRCGNKLSVLGYGCMRFPKKAGRIDMKSAEKQVLAAVEGGVNYFDTAYIYPGSEGALGEILHKNGIRDRVYIATKLPHYLIKGRESLDKMFNEQLRRLQTDYVDYYLMHMLTDAETWERLKELGIEDWINEKKACGEIRQVGFSYHGNSDMFCSLIDAWDWDFCMIQYNYMDENSQAGRKGLKYAAGKGIPVMVMEPLRGGKLVERLPREAREIFEEHHVKYTPVQWALKWLWNQPEVSVVLSGMNSEEMIRDNIETAGNTAPGELTSDDEDMLRRVVKAINSKMKVECTGCGYCMPCPNNVDIPGTFAAYNRKFQEGSYSAFIEYLMCTALRKNSTAASNCSGCGKCEKHCPQNIRIRDKIREAGKSLEGPMYKVSAKVVKVFAKF